MMRLLAYLGFGALLYALFHGGLFVWESPWTWAWLLLWPLMLLLELLKWSAIVALLIVPVILVVALAPDLRAKVTARWPRRPTARRRR